MTKVRMIRERQSLLSAPTAAPIPSPKMPTAWVMDNNGVAPESMHSIVDDDGVINEPISALIENAKSLGIEQKVLDWAELRFGENWHENAGEVLQSFSEVVDRFKGNTPIYLDLSIRLLASGIDFQSVALPYIKKTFGGIGGGQNMIEIFKHIDELIDQGVDFALSVMK